MKKREKKVYPIVTINERFRLRLDDGTMVLETQKGTSWDFVGYYRRLEHALKRVAQIEADSGFDTITIREYMQRVLSENEKMHTLFDGLYKDVRKSSVSAS
jgi:hypothetical protein